jgi:hypothetical protein
MDARLQLLHDVSTRFVITFFLLFVYDIAYNFIAITGLLCQHKADKELQQTGFVHTWANCTCILCTMCTLLRHLIGKLHFFSEINLGK